jgi:type IV secretion system protein VirB2
VPSCNERLPGGGPARSSETWLRGPSCKHSFRPATGDPIMHDASSSMEAAVNWVQAVLLGSIGTTVAVVAVGVVGMMMLAGRLPVRRGAAVVLGCFVLFSASTIAEALVQASSTGTVPPVTPPPPPTYRPTVPTPVPYDPYAGASVPEQKQTPVLR